MDEQTQLRLSNDQWQQDDDQWQREIQDWQRETQRLVALLYMLEKALPEHSTRLDRHKARIDKHQHDLMRYRCGLEEQCLPDCPSRINLDKQKHLHKIMARNHRDMQQEHEHFSRDYLNKMQRFRDLAQRMLDELNEIV